MPTIKTKKEMNLPELIDWIWENDIRNRQIRADQDISAVSIDKFGDVYTTDYVKSDYTFTVEIEEPITEDTKLYLVERYISSYEGFKLKYRTHPNRSINSILEYNQSHLKTTHVYAEVNNELTLIWTKEKGMVE